MPIETPFISYRLGASIASALQFLSLFFSFSVHHFNNSPLMRYFPYMSYRTHSVHKLLTIDSGCCVFYPCSRYVMLRKVTWPAVTVMRIAVCQTGALFLFSLYVFLLLKESRASVHWAASRGHAECLELLLRNGGDVDSITDVSHYHNFATIISDCPLRATHGSLLDHMYLHMYVRITAYPHGKKLAP